MVLVLIIIMDETISACRFLKVKGSYMPVSTVFGAIVLVLIIINASMHQFQPLLGS